MFANNRNNELILFAVRKCAPRFICAPHLLAYIRVTPVRMRLSPQSSKLQICRSIARRARVHSTMVSLLGQGIRDLKTFRLNYIAERRTMNGTTNANMMLTIRTSNSYIRDQPADDVVRTWSRDGRTYFRKRCLRSSKRDGVCLKN